MEGGGARGVGLGAVQGARLGGEAQAGGAPAEGPDAGVGVPHPEQRIALPLDEMVRGDAGPVVRGGMEQRPPGGVGPERRGVLGSGYGPQIDELTVFYGGPPAVVLHGGPPALVLDGGPPALTGDDPYDGVGDDLGPHLVRHPQREHLPGEGVPMAVPLPLCADLPNEVLERIGLLTEPEVEEPRPGDDDVLDAVRRDEPGPQDLGDGAWRLPGRAGELERDIGRVLPAPPAPGSLTTTRSGTATLSCPSSTAQRTACSTVRESSTGVTGQG